jgi:hypothetical protein
MVMGAGLVIFSGHGGNHNTPKVSNAPAITSSSSSSPASYNVSVNTLNSTLPDYNAWQMGNNDYGSGLPMYPIFTADNNLGGWGYVYQGTNNHLVFYNVNTSKVTSISSSWINLTMPSKLGNITLFSSGTGRQDLFYETHANGSLYMIMDYGIKHGNYLYVQEYFLYNHTSLLQNTTIPIDYNTTWSNNYPADPTDSSRTYVVYLMNYQGDIVYLDRYTSSTTNPYANNGTYMVNIWSGSVVYNGSGLSIEDNLGNSVMSLYSFSAIAEAEPGVFYYETYNFSTNKMTYQNQTISGVSLNKTTNNNNPIFVTKTSPNKYVIYTYMADTASGSSGEFYSFNYYKSNSTLLTNASKLGFNYNDIETSSNQEVITQNFLISGMNGGQGEPSGSSLTPYSGTYVNYINNTIYHASGKLWLANELNNYQGTGPYHRMVNELNAGTKYGAMYTFVHNSHQLQLNGNFTLYWTNSSIVNSVFKLSVSISSSVNPAKVNSKVTFTSVINSGQPPYSYAWKINGNPISSSSSFANVFSKAGSYNISLTVKDSSENVTSVNMTEKISHIFSHIIIHFTNYDKKMLISVTTTKGTYTDTIINQSVYEVNIVNSTYPVTIFIHSVPKYTITNQTKTFNTQDNATYNVNIVKSTSTFNSNMNTYYTDMPYIMGIIVILGMLMLPIVIRRGTK